MTIIPWSCNIYILGRINATKREGGSNLIDTNKLKGAIVANGKNQKQIAEELGIDKSTFYRKMKEGGTFSIGEVSQMAEIIPLSDTEAIGIFFNHEVAETQQKEKV